MVTNAVLTAPLAARLRLAGLLDLTTAVLVLRAATSVACFVIGRQVLPVGINSARPGVAMLRSDGRALVHFFSSGLWLANSMAVPAAQLDLFLAAHSLAAGIPLQVDSGERGGYPRAISDPFGRD